MPDSSKIIESGNSKTKVKKSTKRSNLQPKKERKDLSTVNYKTKCGELTIKLKGVHKTKNNIACTLCSERCTKINLQ